MTFTLKTALDTLVSLRAFLNERGLIGASNDLFLTRIIGNVNKAVIEERTGVTK